MNKIRYCDVAGVWMCVTKSGLNWSLCLFVNPFRMRCHHKIDPAKWNCEITSQVVNTVKSINSKMFWRSFRFFFVHCWQKKIDYFQNSLLTGFTVYEDTFIPSFYTYPTYSPTRQYDKQLNNINQPYFLLISVGP